MLTLILTILRPIAWLLVILGVLFTYLQAYLLGIPMLLTGLVFLWFLRMQSLATLKRSRLAHEGPSDAGCGDNMHRGKNNPFSRWFIADDADAENPFFGINDHLDPRNSDIGGSDH
jgi:fatty acid desaturase